MTQRVGPLLAVAWCVVAPLITAGCARQRSVATTPAAADSTSAHDPVTLRVTNSTVEFTVPVEFVTSSGSVTLVADPVAGRRPWTTTLPAVMPGDEFELVVESFLQYSHLVVR